LKKSVFGKGAALGGVLGAVIGGMRVLQSSQPGLIDVLGVVLIPLWMVIGVIVGVIVQQCFGVVLRKPMTWEAGAMHKISPTNPAQAAAARDPYAIGSWLAVVISLGMLGLLTAAVGLIYLPILLQ